MEEEELEELLGLGSKKGKRRRISLESWMGGQKRISDREGIFQGGFCFSLVTCMYVCP